MFRCAGLYPLQVDQLRYKKLGQRLLNLIIGIDREHSKRSRRAVASRLHLQRQIMEEVNGLPAGVQERSDVIRQPDSRENILISFTGARRKISLRDEHWHIRGNSVFMPNLHDMAHQLGLVIQHAPRGSAWLIRIVLEGKKREIVHAAMLLHVIDKTCGPRDFSVRIRPDLDVFIHSLKRRPAQLQLGIHVMNRGRPLQIERGVIFRQHVLPISFLAHLDIGNRIAAFFQICNLRPRIVRSVIQHRDRHHGGKSASNAACEEQIKSHLRLFGRSQIGGLMPRIDRRTIRGRLLLIRGVAQNVVECTVVCGCAQIEFANRIAHTIPRITRPIGITGVR